MSGNSKIEWTEATWNPTLGCSKISPGCKGCYAILDVHRMAGNPNPKMKAANSGLTIIQNGHPNWTGKVRFVPDRLDMPLRTKKPSKFFVNSLSDLFHQEISDRTIIKVFKVMYRANWHTFQILTKHGEVDERLVEITKRVVATFGPMPRHIWLGVSVEDKKRLYRIELLRRAPAAVRFLSIEPLLEDLGQLNLSGIDWVICGGESGRGARPMNPEWARSIQRQCQAAGVPFFFKQWGKYSPNAAVEAVRTRGINVPDGDGTHHRMFPVGKKFAGRTLDGRTWDEMPEVRA